MSLLVEERAVTQCEPALSKDDSMAVATTARDEEEAADFVTRHVLERGATFFDG